MESTNQLTMKETLLSFLFILISAVCIAQKEEKGYTHPDEVLIGDKALPKILLVGTWHFDYPGLDAHEIREEDRIHILSPKRQQELQELLDYLSLFKPTRIAVEGGRNSGYLIRRFERWKNGTRPLGASEIDQIAIRLMDRFQLDTLYGVDAYPLLLELRDHRDTTLPIGYTDHLLDQHYFGGEDEMSIKYNSWYELQDKEKVHHTLLENFHHVNSDKMLDREFGAYISGGQFDSDGNEGPDALSMFWMNRNLRIFKNICDTEPSAEDRVLVLFGAGHISLLRFFFECSPEFQLVEFSSLDTNTARRKKSGRHDR